MKTFALVVIAALVGLANCDDWEKPEWCRDHDCPKFKVVSWGACFCDLASTVKGSRQRGCGKHPRVQTANPNTGTSDPAGRTRFYIA